MKKCLPLLWLFLFSLSGCGQVEINNAAIPLAVSSDYRDGKIVVSAQMAKPVSPEESDGTGPQFYIITGSGKTLSEATRNTSRYFSSIPLWSHTQLSINGEALAKKGITPIIDFLVRNRYTRRNNPVVITHNATPEEILNVKPYLEPYTAMAIKRLLRNQEVQLGIYTSTDLNEFLQKLANPGIEPFAPMITIGQVGPEKQILLDGTAVFKGDRMVGSLNEEESRGLHLIQPKTNTGGLFLVPSPLNQENRITLEISRSQAKTIPVIQGQAIHMQIHVKMEGNFYEQGGTDNLFTPEGFAQIEAAAEKELERQINMTIRKAQSLNSDIFGWGYSVYRTDPETWKTIEPEWNQRFPNMPYEVSVKFELRRSYLTDKTFVFR